MLKIPDLRAHLVAAVPELARDPERVIVMASGSEVSLAMEAVKILEGEAPGRKFRVVSMPSWAAVPYVPSTSTSLTRTEVLPVPGSP